MQLPPDVVEYDRQVPLIAEPGSDRRRQTPEPILEAIRQAERNAVRQGGQTTEIADTSIDHAQAGRASTPPASVSLNAENIPSAGGPRPENAIAAQTSESAAGLTATEAKVPSGFLDFTEQPHGSVSGPSFLGLSDERMTELPDDEPQETNMRTRWYIALAITVLLAVLVMTQFPEIAKANLQYAKSGMGFLKQQYARLIHHTPETAPLTVTPQPPASNQISTADQATPSLAQNEGANAPEDNPERASKDLAKAESTPSPDAPTAPNQSTHPAANVHGKATDKAEPGQAAITRVTNEARGTQAVAPSHHQQDSPMQPALKPALRVEKIVPGRTEYEKALAASYAPVSAALLWRALALGNPDAPVRLADMYIAGQGVRQSCDQAMVLLHAAADKGNARARARLGSLYATGNCVPRNRVEAYRWMSLAEQANPSSEWIEQNRQTVWGQMSAGERAMAVSMAR